MTADITYCHYNMQSLLIFRARSTKNVKSAEEQRKVYEQSLKKQAFQEQQKKLKEFNNMSGRKINADAMIQHIVGPTITAAPKPGINVIETTVIYQNIDINI